MVRRAEVRGAPLTCLFAVSSSTGFFWGLHHAFLSFTAEAMDYTSTGSGAFNAAGRRLVNAGGGALQRRRNL